MFIFFQAETIFLNQDLEEKNENHENGEEEDEKLFWLEACYKALTWHRKNKHVQVGLFHKFTVAHNCACSIIYILTGSFFLP